MVSGFDQAGADPIENESIQDLALLGGGEGGESNRTGRARRQVAALSWPISGRLARWKSVILRQIHADQLRRQEQEQRSIQLPALNRRRPFQEIAEIEAEDIDDQYFRLIGPNRAERFQVAFARLRGEDEELADACPLLPRFDKFVHHPVKRSAPQRRTARKRAGGCVYSILDGRGTRDAEQLG
jgi:hypothetical protein